MQAVVLAVVAWVALGGVAAAGVAVAATLVSADGGQARVLADITPVPPGPLPAGAITVTAGTSQLPVTATPLLADSLALGLVLDASAAGAAALPQGLSGAANLVLQLPAAAAVGVVTDASPPVLLAPPTPGPSATLKALDAVQPAGGRQTEAALSMAARLLPDTPGPRVLVLYTGAADAGGVAATDLAARLLQDNVVLAVVATAADPAYWSKVATATGGAVVPTNATNAIGAFNTVAELLRTRYQLSFTLPQPAPTSVTISVDTGTGPQTAQASVVTPAAAPPPAPRTDSNSGTLRRAILIAVGVLVLANILWLLLRARRRSPPGSRGGPDPEPESGREAGAGREAGPGRESVPGRQSEPGREAGAGRESGPGREPGSGSGSAAEPEPGSEGWGSKMAAAIAANPLPVFGGAENADRGPDEPNVRVIRAEDPPGPATAPGPTDGDGTSGPAGAGAGAGDGVFVDALPTTPIRLNQIMAGMSPTQVSPAEAAAAEAVAAAAGSAAAGQAAGAAGGSVDGGEGVDGGRAPGKLAGAAVNGTGARDAADDQAYMLLDAAVAEAAAAVEAGRMDGAHAVARIALAAAGRVDLIDRRATNEARLARARQAIWPPPVRVLSLLREARLVSTGQVPLTGPDGAQVRQDGATLRLTRPGEPARDCGSVAELADHVDVDDLAVAERVD